MATPVEGDRVSAERSRTRVVLVSAALIALAVAACLWAVWAVLDDDSARAEPDGVEILVPSAASVAALDVTSTGRVIFGERLTGRVLSVDPAEISGEAGPSGGAPATEIARVDTQSTGQRGLLGLVGADDGRMYASWTRTGDGLMVVGELIEGLEPRIVWEGPVSASGANGGHIEQMGDGRLLIGIGTLLNSALNDDPDAPNGKLLALDPDGAPDQRPEVISTNWNNPFAFDVGPDGEIWVADNAPTDEQVERVGRGEADAALLELDTSIAPAALVALEDGSVAVCGWLQGELTRIELADGVPTGLGDRLTQTFCTTGAAQLPDGRLVLADETRIRLAEV